MFLVPAIGLMKTKITSVSYVTHTTSEHSSTITAPSNILPGDLLVMLDHAEWNGSTPTNVTPAGWTSIGTTGALEVRVSASYKIAIGNEDSTTITGMTEDTNTGKVIFQYRGNYPITSISASTPVAVAPTTNDPAQQTIAASSGIAPVIGFTSHHSNAGNAIDGDGERIISITPNHEVLTDPDRRTAYVQDYIQNSSPANYTFDMADKGPSNCLFGFYIHNFSS